jgi:hypothetical protein
MACAAAILTTTGRADSDERSLRKAPAPDQPIADKVRLICLRVWAMHRLKTGIILAGVALAGGVAWSQTHEAATCPTTVVLRGISYTPAEASEEVISGEEFGTGEERGCGWKGTYTQEIAMHLIPGVDAGLAIASPVSARTVYLAPGVTPDELPEHFGTVTVPAR